MNIGDLEVSADRSYFRALAGPISANRGTIDKFIGDSTMAFWNAPEPDPDHVFPIVRRNSGPRQISAPG